MDIKNNLIPNQLAVKYSYCIFNILTKHRDSDTEFANADVCICGNRLILYVAQHKSSNRSINHWIFAKSLRNTDAWSGNHSFYMYSAKWHKLKVLEAVQRNYYKKKEDWHRSRSKS